MATAVQTNLVPISMALGDFVQGGLLSDRAVEVLAIQFRPFEYEGKAKADLKGPVLTVWMQLGMIDPDTLRRTDEEPSEQYLTTGGYYDEVIISKSETQALPHTKTAFTRGSNWEVFINSLAKPLVATKVPPMPEDYLKGGDLAALLGMKFHLIRQKAPPRPGLESNRAQTDYEKQVVVCRQLYAGPWARGVSAVRTAAAGAAVAPAAAAAAAGPVAVDQPVNGGMNDVASLALESVRGALKVNAMYNTVDQLKLFVFQGLGRSKVEMRNAVANLISPEWLVANGFKVSPPDAQGQQIVQNFPPPVGAPADAAPPWAS